MIESSLENKNLNKEKLVSSLASQLHDNWRMTRFNSESGFCETRLKTTVDQEFIAKTGKNEVDIANTSYENLPIDWQSENRASAEIAIGLIETALREGVDLDDDFIETASSALHDDWVSRNDGAPDWQKAPYAELPEEEKEKDRIIIRLAIDCYNEILNLITREVGSD